MLDILEGRPIDLKRILKLSKNTQAWFGARNLSNIWKVDYSWFHAHRKMGAFEVANKGRLQGLVYVCGDTNDNSYDWCNALIWDIVAGLYQLILQQMLNFKLDCLSFNGIILYHIYFTYYIWYIIVLSPFALNKTLYPKISNKIKIKHKLLISKFFFKLTISNN